MAFQTKKSRQVKRDLKAVKNYVQKSNKYPGFTSHEWRRKLIILEGSKKGRTIADWMEKGIRFH